MIVFKSGSIELVLILWLNVVKFFLDEENK